MNSDREISVKTSCGIVGTSIIFTVIPFGFAWFVDVWSGVLLFSIFWGLFIVVNKDFIEITLEDKP